MVPIHVYKGHFLISISRLLVLFTLSLSAVKVCAGDKVDKIIDASSVKAVFVENVRGRFEIIGWDKPQIHLQGELDDSAERLVLKAKGEKAMVKVVMNGLFHRGHGSDLKLFLPQQTKLRFKGVDTDYQISNFNSKVEGKTIKGDLIIDKIQGKLVMSSVSGKIKIKNSSGVAIIESVSGKVGLSGQFQQVAIKSMSGSVMANIEDTDKLKVKNVSGDTFITGQLRDNADIQLQSVTGNIKYTSSEGFNGKCEVASQFGGNINNELTTDQPWKEKMQQKKLKFVSGDGSGKLVMNTISGNVTLDKAN